MLALRLHEGGVAFSWKLKVGEIGVAFGKKPPREFALLRRGNL